jgi:hypothetical protein
MQYNRCDFRCSLEQLKALPRLRNFSSTLLRHCCVGTVGAPALKNRRFKVRLGGRVTGGTTTNFTVKLYLGAAINSLIFTSGAIAVNSVSGNFHLEAELDCDSTSKILQGLARGQVNASAVAQAATTAVASTDPTVAQSFSASGTFSVSNASNAAVLDYLEVDGE